MEVSAWPMIISAGVVLAVAAVSFDLLTWPMTLRITAAIATGIILIGVVGWPLVAPADPFGTVSLFKGTVSFTDAAALAALAFLAGFSAYFLSWPWGRELGILAAPGGLSILAIHTGNMTALLQVNRTFGQRQAAFAILKWEGLFWLAIVAAGFCGTALAQKIFGQKAAIAKTEEKNNPKLNRYFNAFFTLVGSGLVAQVCIGIFAQNVRMLNNKLGLVTGQPAAGQIAFAVFLSFAIAAFIVKKFLNAGCHWPIGATFLVSFFAMSTYSKEGIMRYILQNWPAAFFHNASSAILPVQTVAFGMLGAVAGYWIAVRYNYWRKHAS